MTTWQVLAAECLPTLVSASCTMRYADRSIPAGTSRTAPVRSTATSTPAPAVLATSRSRSASPGAGASGAPVPDRPSPAALTSGRRGPPPPAPMASPHPPDPPHPPHPPHLPHPPQPPTPPPPASHVARASPGARPARARAAQPRGPGGERGNPGRAPVGGGHQVKHRHQRDERAPDELAVCEQENDAGQQEKAERTHRVAAPDGDRDGQADRQHRRQPQLRVPALERERIDTGAGVQEPERDYYAPDCQ